MVHREVTISNENGIHCRPSAAIMKYLHKVQECSVTLHSGGLSCDARSILGLMSMGLAKGDVVRIDVEGPDTDSVADELATLFSTNFDFPPSGQ